MPVGVLVMVALAADPSRTAAQPAQAATAADATPQAAPGEATAGKRDAKAGQLEEVVVTAQRRSERLQDVPLAVTTLTSSALKQQGVTTTSDLSQVAPALVFNNNANVASPYIRGVGSDLIDPTSESPVAVYVDDVYIASPQSNLFTLAGIKQIDVLEGPQGTLFGRNATGGVLQIQTLDPTPTPHVDLAATYGSYDFFSLPVYATTGLGQHVSTDLSALYENQGQGYGRNLYDGRSTFLQAHGNYSLRNKWLVDLPTGTTVRFSVDYANLVNTDGYQKPKGTFSPLNGETYPGAYNTNENTNDFSQVREGGLSLKVDQDLGPIGITSVSAYRETRDVYVLDEDATTAPAIGLELDEKFRNFSQELRIKNQGTSRFNWIVGAYFYDSTGGYDPFRVNGAVAIPFDQQHTVSTAGFGQASFKVFPDTEITGGLRYTDENQTFTLPAASLTAKQAIDKITYRVALDHHFSKEVLGYVSYSTGFKSGGYNLVAPGNAFKPEELASLEVGLKTELFDRKLRLNVDGFLYNYTNEQVLLPTLAGTIVTNAAGSHIKGLEANFDALPLDGLKISGGVSLLHGRYTNLPGEVALDQNGIGSRPFNAKGNTTVDSPDAVFNLSARYRVPTSVGEFEGDAGVQYDSGFFWLPDNRIRQPAYTVVNASLNWTPDNGRYGVRVWVRNLLDTTYYLARVTLPFPVGDAQQQSPPRTAGLTLSYHF